jgi:tetratricopeptide (TPR) repeat protein
MNTARKIFREKFVQSPHAMVSDIYEKRGEVFRLVGEYVKAFNSFKKNELVAEITKNDLLTANSKENLGSIYLFKGEFDQAKIYYTEALKMFKSINNEQGQANCYKNLGTILQNYEKYEHAEDYYKKAIAIYNNLNDENGVCGVLMHLAGNYRKLGQYEKALKECESILFLYERGRNKGKLIRIYQLMGNLFIERNEFEEGIKFLKQSYDIAISIGDNLAIIYLLCDLGISCYVQKNYQSAIAYFEDCLRLSEKNNDIYMISIACLNLGDTYMKINELVIARKYLSKADNTDICINGIKNEIKKLLQEINSIERR